MSNLQDHHMEDAYELWTQTGWNDGYRVSLADFMKSWQASAVKKCIVQDGQVVAIGRANSDGILYSMIHDIVVHRDHRGKGLGRSIVLEVVQELKAMKVRSIQLMAAKGQAAFYERLGFEIRPNDAPGMQYTWKSAQQGAAPDAQTGDGDL